MSATVKSTKTEIIDLTAAPVAAATLYQKGLERAAKATAATENSPYSYQVAATDPHDAVMVAGRPVDRLPFRRIRRLSVARAPAEWHGRSQEVPSRR